MFPPRVRVKLCFEVPIQINTGAVGDYSFQIAVRLNSIANPATGIGTQTLGNRSFSQLVGTSPLPVGANGGTMIIETSSAGAYVYDTPYRHLGNIYAKYRVKTASMTLTLQSLLSQSSTTTAPSAGATVVNLFATDDLEAVNTVASLDRFFSRPYIRHHRYHTTRTILNQYRGAPTKIRYSSGVLQLIKDRIAVTSGDFDGTCTRGVSGAQPTYADPSRFVYMGFQIHPFGIPNGITYPATTAILTGYMSVSHVVDFFEPHDNADFFTPL